MRDISNKPSTRRRARAEAWVRIPPDCMRRIEQGTIDKGDVREAARIAGMMGIKKCWELLPHCHPIPLQHSAVDFEIHPDGLRIEALVATLGPTGVEMEALTGVNIAALTVYDMLKPHAGMDLSIEGVRLLEKTGGKSDLPRVLRQPYPASLITVSGPVQQGKPDHAGDYLAEALNRAGFTPVNRLQLSPSIEGIQEAVDQAVANDTALIITIGGTGLMADDCCTEAIKPMLEREIPGIMETARQFGQQRTPLALMSRGIAGQIRRSLIINLPGNRAGAEESWQAIAVGVLHAIHVLHRGHTHPDARS